MSDSYDRLIEFQQENINNANKKIELFDKYKEDYIELKKLIDCLKDTTKKAYNIPIAGSSLALMPGHIIHTNEILVLLGDNYFTLRSSKQACEIIDRRIGNIDQTLARTKEARKKSEDWLNATLDRKQEKEDFVEIIETFDPSLKLKQ